MFEGSLKLELPTSVKCSATWETLNNIPLPESIRPSAEFPTLPPVMLAHFRSISERNESTKLNWLMDLTQHILQQDITNKILILVENSTVAEGICSALSLAMTSATSSILSTLHSADVLDSDNWSDKSYVRVDSSASQGQRAQLINLFTDDPTVAVCVATRSIAGVGLNLTVANVVVLFEPAPTLGEEAQAINRVMRLGQTRAVRIYRLYMKNSIEERRLWWRKKKGELGRSGIIASSDTMAPSFEDCGGVTDFGKVEEECTTSEVGGTNIPVLEEWRALLGSV